MAFIIIDGIDGSGKDVFCSAMADAARADGLAVFDAVAHWKAHGRHPEPADWKRADVVVTAEPTYVHAGKLIREELIRNDADYSSVSVAQAYALDRAILYDRVIRPALAAGKTVLQTRSVSTSLVYQPADAARRGEALGVEDVRSLPGNAAALATPPTHLVIVTAPVAEALRRLGVRAKQDDAKFEQEGFLTAVKEGFESAWFRGLYEGLGTEVIYASSEGTLEDSRRSAQELYRRLTPRRRNR